MSHVRNAWYVAAWSHQLETAKPYAITLLEDRIMIEARQRVLDGRESAA